MPKTKSDYDYWADYKKIVQEDIKKMIDESDGREVGPDEQLALQGYAEQRMDTDTIQSGLRIPIFMLRQLHEMRPWLMHEPELYGRAPTNSEMIRVALAVGILHLKRRMEEGDLAEQNA